MVSFIPLHRQSVHWGPLQFLVASSLIYNATHCPLSMAYFSLLFGNVFLLLPAIRAIGAAWKTPKSVKTKPKIWQSVGIVSPNFHMDPQWNPKDVLWKIIFLLNMVIWSCLPWAYCVTPEAPSGWSFRLCFLCFLSVKQNFKKMEIKLVTWHSHGMPVSEWQFSVIFSDPLSRKNDGQYVPNPIGFILLSGYMGQAKQNPDTGLSFTLLGIFLVSHSNFLGSSFSSVCYPHCMVPNTCFSR